MPAEEIFRAQIADPESDAESAELRRILTRAKLEALDQVVDLSEAGLRLVIPGLHAQLAETSLALADRLGAAVAFALMAADEQRARASVSGFKRDVREMLSHKAVELKAVDGSARFRFVAEVMAQRLACRHNHELLSWLAFKRDDPEHGPSDRLARVDGFHVSTRLLKSRAALRRLLGAPLAASLESHDRFLLLHRWASPPGDEGALESLNWRLLSYQDEAFVELEALRWRYDALAADLPDAERAQDPQLNALHDAICDSQVEQLGLALAAAPAHATARPR